MTSSDAVGPERVERLVAGFQQRYGRAPDGVWAAPGRVNVIGEHTDYNDGFVLPAAIDLEIRIAYVATDDRRVELLRLDGGERDGFELDVPRARAGSWLDFVAGVAWALGEAG